MAENFTFEPTAYQKIVDTPEKKYNLTDSRKEKIIKNIEDIILDSRTHPAARAEQISRIREDLEKQSLFCLMPMQIQVELRLWSYLWRKNIIGAGK